jgi:crossover junction endodeoxyribonuclease RusA
MIINIAPIPKGRPRFSRFGGVYTPQRTRDFEEAVKWKLKEVFKNPIDAEVEIQVHFYYKRDADIDNFCKAFLDACNGVVFNDDRQVVCLIAKKYKDAKNPRILFTTFVEDKI